tara:strand:+ start:2281 stop:2445 length:165 start_codon:yes stop_codon:yes gene_type:complete
MNKNILEVKREVTEFRKDLIEIKQSLESIRIRLDAHEAKLLTPVPEAESKGWFG